MPTPDLERYSLILRQNDNIILTSREGGLAPLIKALNSLSGYNNLVLTDRVIGLAAAKFLAFNKQVTAVHTPVCSKSAFHYLNANGIKIVPDSIVPNILTKDRLDVCGMEKVALEMEDLDKFCLLLINKFIG